MTMPIAQERQRKSWDFILTIFLLVAYLGWSLLCSFAGALLAMAGDSCGASSTCDFDRLGAAFLLGVFGPAVLAIVVLIFAIVWMVRRHISFWIPIAGSILAAGIVGLAFFLATTGVVPVS
jgi:uncharacterized membrane protein (DUF485 family)